MAFILPIIKNCFSYSKSCATYSRNSENGGLVTTTSDSCKSSRHSRERKSPGGYFSSPDKSRPPVGFDDVFYIIKVKNPIAVFVCHLGNFDNSTLGIAVLCSFVGLRS